jgi:hypothetical protein
LQESAGADKRKTKNRREVMHTARDSDYIDISWIPKAKEAWHATNAQLHFVNVHIERVRERRNRFAINSLPYVFAQVELSTWEQIAELLKANLEGKTVQPS